MGGKGSRIGGVQGGKIAGGDHTRTADVRIVPGGDGQGTWCRDARERKEEGKDGECDDGGAEGKSLRKGFIQLVTAFNAV